MTSEIQALSSFLREGLSTVSSKLLLMTLADILLNGQWIMVLFIWHRTSSLLSIHSLQDHAHNLKKLLLWRLSFLSPEVICTLNAKPRYSTVYFMCTWMSLQPPHVGNWSSSLDLPFILFVWFSHPGSAQMKTLGVCLEPLPHVSFKYLNPVDPIPH